ncbi:ADP-glyceromanno-heptose 6-epimerase [Candidatus Cloacimonadota bacterium]
MILLTGGAGFIGSNFLKKLNDEGFNDILIIDSLDNSEKWKNLVGKKFTDYCHKKKFSDLIQNGKTPNVKVIFHFGACSSTTEKNSDYLMSNNFYYSKNLFKWANRDKIKFIYASSAATYGDGEFGYSDSNENSLRLRPLNMYGYSKQLFDEYIIRNNLDSFVTGLKFFNVFGPNEYHKGSMRSMVHKAFQEIEATDQINLFKSNDKNFKDGEQKRDFIYIKDCIDVVWWLYDNDKRGIFNVGTGVANTWLSLAKAVFKALKKDENINFIDMPEALANKYQNYTKADIGKLKESGYNKEFFSIENAVFDYINDYLLTKNAYN